MSELSICLFSIWSYDYCRSAYQGIFRNKVSTPNSPTTAFSADLRDTLYLSEAAEEANMVVKDWQECLYTADDNERGSILS